MLQLIKKIAYFIPLLVLLIIVNKIADPSNVLTWGNYEKSIVDSIKKGLNVTNIKNCDERLLQKYFIESLAKAPDVAIFGNSQVMQIGTEIFPNKFVVNNGVSGASLQDYIAIYGVYYQSNKIPKKIILNFCPSLFSDDDSPTQFKSIYKEYSIVGKKMEPEIDLNYNDIISSNYYWIENSLSLNYFQLSFDQLLHQKLTEPKKRILATTNKLNEGGTRLFDDFTITYDIGTRDIDPELVAETVKGYEKNLYRVAPGKFRALGAKKLKLFFDFLEFVKKNGTEIEFINLPYHPEAYDALYRKNPKYIAAEIEFEKLIAGKYSIYGSIDPSKFNMTNGSYYDSTHMRRDSLMKFFSAYINQ